MRPIPSRLSGRLRVGADFYARRGALSTGSAKGLVDRIEELANTGIEVAKVRPAILPFFVDTASLAFRVRSEWRFPFSVTWWAIRLFMMAIGQFVLPIRRARIVAEVTPLQAELDGRPSPRAVVRRYEQGGVMQAVAYSTFVDTLGRYMSASFPMPFGQVLGILRLDPNGEGVALSSTRRGDEAGVYFVLGPWMFRSPLGERLELWAREDAPEPLAREADETTSLVGRHEQRIFGFRFVTHEYWFERR